MTLLVPITKLWGVHYFNPVSFTSHYLKKKKRLWQLCHLTCQFVSTSLSAGKVFPRAAIVCYANAPEKPPGLGAENSTVFLLSWRFLIHGGWGASKVNRNVYLFTSTEGFYPRRRLSHFHERALVFLWSQPSPRPHSEVVIPRGCSSPHMLSMAATVGLKMPRCPLAMRPSFLGAMLVQMIARARVFWNCPHPAPRDGALLFKESRQRLGEGIPCPLMGAT